MANPTKQEILDQVCEYLGITNEDTKKLIAYLIAAREIDLFQLERVKRINEEGAANE